MDYLWDVRLTTHAPSDRSLDAVEESLFDALQRQPGLDLWTVEIDPNKQEVSAHFGLVVAAELNDLDAVSTAVNVFRQACATAGWEPERGHAELPEGPPGLHGTKLDVEYAGKREDRTLVYA